MFRSVPFVCKGCCLLIVLFRKWFRYVHVSKQKKGCSMRLIGLLGMVLFAGVRGVSAVESGPAVFYEHPDFTVYADSVERAGLRAEVDQKTGAIRSSASFDYKTFGRAPFKPDERVATWMPDDGLQTLPQFKSDFPMVDAAYRMALETVQHMVDMQPEGVLNASEGRPPWVRDSSYVVLDGMSFLFPSACRASLDYTADEKSTVKPEQMYAIHAGALGVPGIPSLQPCYAMSDFVIWIPAAMEYAQTTGDLAFLKKYYDCMRRTVDLVRREKFDPFDGLYDGGETIGDGSTAYPEDTTGLVELKGTSVNLIQYQALRMLVRAGELLDAPLSERQQYLQMANRLNDSIQRELWLDDQGFYSYMKVARQPHALERTSAMASAFSILFHAADPRRQQALLENFPDQKWGAPVVWPAWMNRVAYHDQNMWPNVDANWAVAAAKAGNPDRLTKSLAILTENAAFELGFSEMISLFQGDHRGKKPQLWAATGFLRMILDGVIGLEACPQGLIIQPNVPQAFSSGVVLSGLRWRDAELDIRLKGNGRYIRSFRLDGNEVSHLLPSTLSGAHRVEISMASEPAVRIAAPFDVPAGLPVTVRTDCDTLDVLFGDASAVQHLAPVEPGVFTIDWPAGQMVDRIRVLPSDQDCARRGRWQTINVRPALEAEFLPGDYEACRPLVEARQIELSLRLRNNRPEPVSCTVQLRAARGITVSEDVAVRIPANADVNVPLDIGLPAGLSYGTVPVTATVSGVEAVYHVKIAESLDLRGIWMMKGTEQEDAASPDLYDISDGWSFVRLPGRWEFEEKYKEYDDAMWYRKTVLVPSEWAGHDLEFYLENVSGNETAWFNGVKIGSGTGANPRRYPIGSDLVKPGENNVIAVQVVNPSDWPKSGLTAWPMRLSVLP
jgi:hypothetical protein